MRIGAFEVHEPVPELREPHAIALIRPWIDVGSAGTLALTCMERHFEAQELGRLARPGTFFDFTRYRPTMRFVEGQREVTVPNSVVYYAHQASSPDLLFLHLLEPHAFAEDYADAILELLKWFGVKRYCRVGGMYDAVPHTRPLQVTGLASSGQLQQMVGGVRLRTSTYQGPTTIMNLVSQGVEQLDIETMGFMVHLPQYVQLEEDYAGGARLLEVLGSLYGLPPALLDRERQQQYRELSTAIERNPELKALIERLEAYYDAQEAAVTEEESPRLSPEVEQFLQELNQRLDDS